MNDTVAQIPRAETFLDPETETGLPVKEERFCQEYVTGAKPGIAVHAALAAGFGDGKYFAAAQAGSSMLKRPEIKRRVSELQKRLQERLEISTERVLAEYAKLAFSDMSEVMDFDESDGGLPGLKDPRTIPAHARRAIKKLKVKRRVVVDGDGNETPFRDDEVTVELHAKKEALDKLGEHLGLFAGDGGRGPTVNVFVIEVPERAADARSWGEKYRRLAEGRGAEPVPGD